MISRFKKPTLRPFLLLLLLLFAMNACKKEPQAKRMPATLASYIYGFTSGSISRADPIKVHFNNVLVSNEQVGNPVDANLLSFSPSIKGEAVWEDNKTISFQPDEYLPSNKKYVAKLQVKKIIPSVPKDAEVLEFDFRTREQYITLETDGIQSESPSDLSKQQLTGTLYTADVAPATVVEQVLSASQRGKNLDVKWSHSEDQLAHNFVVNNITRSSSDSEVSLKWNGKELDVDKKDSKTLEIPALGRFKMLDARVVTGDEPYILVNFSDPLLEPQDLQGFVGINGYEGAMKTDIDGNFLRIYPSIAISEGMHNLAVSANIKNMEGKAMEADGLWSLEFADAKPQVRLVGNGVIIPESDGLIFPFEAINLNAVEVEVFKIYQNNLLQFLQNNALNSSDNLYQVGKIISRKKIDLNPSNRGGKSAWKRYAFDLKPLIEQDKGAMYQISIGFKPEYATNTCNPAFSTYNKEEELPDTDEYGNMISMFDNYYGSYGYYDGYNYEDRNNPCRPAYYNPSRFVRRNVLASNIGLVVKRGNNGQLLTIASDLRTAEPLSGVKVDVYDFTKQLIISGSTDGSGILALQPESVPYFVIATKDKDASYIRLHDGSTLSLSKFDVAGEIAQKGLKGYIYGERDIWRPGDSLFLTFVLEDKDNKLPDNHPVSFELFDTKGQLQQTITQTNDVKRIYRFATATRSDAPTGVWSCKVKVGGATFSRNLRIETIKPNRLKINLNLGKETLTKSDTDLNAQLNALWLNGASAKSLKAKVELLIEPMPTTFDKYKNYAFDDPKRKFSMDEPTILFDAALNEQGSANVPLKISTAKEAPGFLRLKFKTTVFEKGGDFSTDYLQAKYAPYDAYVGINIPKNKYGEDRIELNKESPIHFVSIGNQNNPLPNRNITMEIYRVEWSWWYDSEEEATANFNASTNAQLVKTSNLVTKSDGTVSEKVKLDSWGRYLVRTCDNISGHCAGSFFYAGYPWQADDNAGAQAASMLSITANKPSYKVGDVVQLTIPVGEISKGLITIENGSGVLETKWFKASKGDFAYSFKVTKEMAPNVFAHISLLQPHAQTKNDLPIRMYGVVPIAVEDAATKLQPAIAMSKELQPDKDFVVEVSEKEGREMGYTIAVVDEGLLDLTRFKTPNPWDHFFAKEALGVKTWDIYDHVLGAYGAQLERMLSIGGDGAIVNKNAAEKANRFKPVVHYIGPFALKKGQKAKHTLKMPNYVGSVRTMVVAANEGAYGSAEQTTPVRKPLMVLATVPRVVSPTETIKLPVNVFVMDKKIQNVQVTLENNALFEVIGERSKNIAFNAIGDQLVEFDIKVKDRVGVGSITAKVTGGGETASQTIELDVRNPNPYVTSIEEDVLEGNETWVKPFNPLGVSGTNTVTLEISSIPAINFGDRMQYLLSYPHGCVEQTTSAAFPQLFASKLVQMTDEQQKTAKNNINTAIEALKKFQTNTGGFGYWPGDDYNNAWSTNYVGHFLLEAQTLGYAVPNNIIERWKKYQKKAAERWSPSYEDRYYNSDLDQAYRLYTLALAKAPEMGAMNRLREQKVLSDVAKWRLAGAYALAGKTEVSEQLINKLSTDVKAYRELGGTFGSNVRDQAMILEVLALLGKKTTAATLSQIVSKQLSSQSWLSTQETAYSLLAISKFVGTSSVSNKFTCAFKLGNGNWTNAGSNNAILQIDVPADKQNIRQVEVKNGGNTTLFARIINKGQPALGDKTNSSKNLAMTVVYKAMDGKAINPANITQGTDFLAEVTVTNNDIAARYFDELALEMTFPSGWEIHNSRIGDFNGVKSDQPTYQDVRDDRVYNYFDLAHKTSKKFVVQLQAAYQGKYYLPSFKCSAMYDNDIQARQAGASVNVLGAQSL